VLCVRLRVRVRVGCLVRNMGGDRAFLVFIPTPQRTRMREGEEEDGLAVGNDLFVRHLLV